MPGQSCYYTWIKPSGDRILTWAHENDKNTVDYYENALETDGLDHIRLGMYFVSQNYESKLPSQFVLNGLWIKRGHFLMVVNDKIHRYVSYLDSAYI